MQEPTAKIALLASAGRDDQVCLDRRVFQVGIFWTFGQPISNNLSGRQAFQATLAR